MQVTVGQFGDHNRAIDQHARDQNQAEQHHSIEGKAEHPDQQNTGQKCPGNRQPHQ